MVVKKTGGKTMTLGPVQKIPIKKIKAGMDIRDRRDPSKMAGLKATIKDSGQLVPVIVWHDGEWFYLVDGHGRYLAALELGHENIDGRVLDKQPIASDALKQALICNIQRESLAPLDMGQAIVDLLASTGWTASEAAKHLGLSNATISRLVTLISLPDAIKERVRAGELAVSTACELAKVADPTQQAEMAREAASGRLTRDTVAGRAKKTKVQREAQTAPAGSRMVAILGGGRSISVTGEGLTLEKLIAWIEELLAKARRARTQGWELATLVRTLKDEAKS
jgi:ParB family transcriptional regulator, chromosome partitioning protein